uniref:Palmitoyltransferase n=1 Tax=Globisporangium ultimum (strain ATCC 200006 / CBS 805.95 / DAOM BR144) TaxID=431595 RepID=K3X627_GLOUD
MVAGGYGAFLLTGLPHLPSESLGVIHVFVSFFAVLTALLSFFMASTAPPGILQPITLAYFDNYAYDQVLYTADRECTTCHATKLARSKHCSVCDVCIPRFDHHCVWLNACIGEGNHFVFMRFLFIHVLFCGYGSYVLFWILYDEFARLLAEESFVHEATHAVVQGDPVVVLQYLLHAEAVNTALFVLCAGMGVALVVFFLFHCYLVATNVTTNEFFKRRQQRNCNLPSPQNVYNLGSAYANFVEIWTPRCFAKARAMAAAKHSESSSKQKKRE